MQAKLKVSLNFKKTNCRRPTDHELFSEKDNMYCFGLV